MVGSLPSVPVLLGVTDVFFPGVAALAPSFVSDGEERPPRTI